MVCFLLAPPAASSAETAAQVLARYRQPVIERLMQEKVVFLGNADPAANGDKSLMTALVVFEQPRSRAMRMLSQTARQGEYRPELKRVETVKRWDQMVLDEHQMRIMFMRIDYRVRTHYDFKRSKITWTLDPDFDNDLEVIEGSWELYEIDEDHTLGHFGTKVSVGKAMPIWLQNYATSRNLPQMMERIRRWVDSDGTYRP